MTVEVKAEKMPVVEEPKKAAAEEAATVVQCEKDECKPKTIEKSSSYREESNFLFDLKEHEKKALNELKMKLEEAILENTLFKKEEKKDRGEKPSTEEEECEKVENKKEECETDVGNEEIREECTEIEEHEDESKYPESEVVDRDISIWGVPLLPSKLNEGTNVVLLKFLRAREFKVNEALEMLKKTLQWRKEFNINSILDEEFEDDLASAAHMNGVDREGRPVCYNVFGVLENEEVYEKTLGTEEKREQFLRWRVQLMEKGIRELHFKAGGANSLVQVNDLKDSPGPTKKGVRAAVNKAVAVLQDNYPEFVAKNIFINVPFWYFAFHSLLSPFLSQRTKSKLVFARSSKVTETLVKYIPIEEIPTQYGGIKRENDVNDGEVVVELVIKAGSTEAVEIPLSEAETTVTWDLVVLGWDVNYKEEFVPTDECSYTMIIQKEKKMQWDEGAVRNTFKNHEPGKIVLTLQNSCGKKKRVFYRCKIKKTYY